MKMAINVVVDSQSLVQQFDGQKFNLWNFGWRYAVG
jgi:hypothetical protein